MVQKNHLKHRYSIERLMADVNAAIDGAYAGGATHVTVLDSHGGGGNFDATLLDKRAELDLKENGKWWGKLDDSYGGTFFIGAHAMAGTINGFLDHTLISMSIFNYRVNGRKVGELALWATVAANFNVPLLMMSGDDAACFEARQFFNPVECVTVKRGLGRNRAELVEPDKAASGIREAAKKAMSHIGRAKPFKPILPMEVKLELNGSDYCEEYITIPGVERIDARTIRKMAGSYLEVLFI